MTAPSPILVVDDERHVRSALSRILHRMGLEVVEAETGEGALAQIASRRFACALVDLRMPGMGGVELVRQVRAAAPDLPLLVVAAHGDAEEARRCAPLGVRDFVAKPWDAAELQMAILRVLDEATCVGRASAAEPPRPETLRAGARVADALRMGPLPSRFAPPPALASGEAWAGASVGRVYAALAASDPALHASVLALAAAESGRQLPPDGIATLLGAERAGDLLALAAVRRAYEPEARWGDPARRLAFLHAWMRAVAMRSAAQEIPGVRVEPRRAFLAGLFADLGGIALVAELASRGIASGEALRFAVDQHASASAWIAAEWRLPGECVVTAAQHHSPLPLHRADPSLLLLWACEEIAVATSGSADLAPLAAAPGAARLAGLSVGIRFDVERACRAALERHGPALGASAGTPSRRVA